MVAGWGNERFTYNYSVGGGNSYARLLHAFLIPINERSELLPGIATAWEISNDGLTWTVTIRDGVKFQDGSDLTREDVWWSWMHHWGKDESGLAVERATQSGSQAVARVLDKIERVGTDQVSITTTVADASFAITQISEAANWNVIVPQRPKVHDDEQEKAYDQHPIGAGQMRLVRHVPADLMSFERFDDFYYQPKNGLPEYRRVKFQTLDLRLVPEEATRVAAIRAGATDIAPVSLNSRNQVEASGGRLVFTPEGLWMRVQLMGCWLPEHPCHDKGVRQALDYAIDKKLMQEKLFGGPEVFEVKGWAGVIPNGIGYSPDLDPWPQDVAKARQLLADAGYPNGEGFGKLVVNTWVSTVMPYLPESAQLAADFWRKELGLDVEVKVGDETALKAAGLSTDLYGQILWRDDEGRPDASSGIRTSYAIPGHGARLHEDPTIFQELQDAFAVYDPEARPAALNKAYKHLREETYQLGIGYVNIPWAVGPKVVEWNPWPMATYLSNAHGIVVK